MRKDKPTIIEHVKAGDWLVRREGQLNEDTDGIMRRTAVVVAANQVTKVTKAQICLGDTIRLNEHGRQIGGPRHGSPEQDT